MSVVPEDAVPRLIAVARSARQGRALMPEPVFARMVRGLRVSDTAVRLAVVKQLGRLVRHFALGDTGDEGWQTRSERARREARGSGRPLALDMLMPGGNAALLAEDDAVDLRDAMGAMAHAMASDAGGVTGEDLVRAMAVHTGQLAPAEIDQMVAEVHTAELAGQDLAAAMVPFMSVPRLAEAVHTVDIGALRRAITAVWTVTTLHGLLALQGLHEMLRREGGPSAMDALLPKVVQRVPDGVEALRAHPAYRWFSGFTLPGPLMAVSVALTSMLLVNEPLMLRVVEDYRHRLVHVLGLPEPS